MGKKLTTLIFAALLAAVVTGTAAERSQKIKLLSEGFTLAGLEGKLSGLDSNDTWFFKFDSDVSDGKDIIKAGVAVEVLRSAEAPLL